MRQIMSLRWSDYECDNIFNFLTPEGTTKEEFEKLCNNSLKKAAEIAIAHNGWTSCDDLRETETRMTWVGWNNIVDALAYCILPTHGYEMVELPQVCYTGTSMIRDRDHDDDDNLLDEAFDIISDYNNKVAENHAQELERFCIAKKAGELKTLEEWEKEDNDLL